MRLQKREERLARGNFRPRFENLELRRVLSASGLFNFHGPAVTTPAPTASVTVSGNSVKVVDSNVGDTITVTDSGAGAVNVTITNGTTTVASGSGTGITRVNINATGGGDTVNYTYGTPLTVTAALKSALKSPARTTFNGESISLNLGKGTNTANLDFSAGVSANLNLDVDVSGGANKVTETFGAVANATLKSEFEGYGTGGDTFSATVGSLTAAKAFFDVYGSGGTDNLSVHGVGDIAADSLLGVFLGAGGGDCRSRAGGGDTLTFDYTGTLLGKLGVATRGAGGNETIAQNITLNAGSTGSLYAVESAGRSTVANSLTLNVTDNSGSANTPPASTLAALNAYVFSHAGDTVVNTSNVTAITLPPSWFNGGFGF